MMIRNRIVSLLLAVCLLTGSAVVFAPRANAYMVSMPLPELTGNKAQDVANIALSQVGYRELGGGTVYGAWWTGVTGWGVNYTNLGWCAIFANWCAYQAGAGMYVAYDRGSAVVGNSMSFLRGNAFADTSFSEQPRPGDFIYFGNGGSFDHMAVVVAYDPAANRVTFVGGNQSDAVTQFAMEYTPRARYGKQTISGIARPNYTGSMPVLTYRQAAAPVVKAQEQEWLPRAVYHEAIKDGLLPVQVSYDSIDSAQRRMKPDSADPGRGR